ncbi:MAG: hypothetical protein SFZ03_05705 [Candidatus Melainabacteria bacterium]|nr:hypothetical protein [Candidatus Melainabacteria bacterium]
MKHSVRRRRVKDELEDWYGGKQGHHKVSDRWSCNTQELTQYLEDDWRRPDASSMAAQEMAAHGIEWMDVEAGPLGLGEDLDVDEDKDL